jgi:type III pantothenate kinase
MIVLFDVGNTNIHVSKVINGILKPQLRIHTDVTLTAHQIHQQIKDYIGNNHIQGVAIASVVPRLMQSLTELSETFFLQKPFVLKPGVKTGLIIKTDYPQEVGADLICAAVGIQDDDDHLIIDLGTAIKYIYVSRNQMKGVIITPGVDISMRALVGSTALLPDITIEIPKKILGTNTIECMQSGVTYGVAAQIDGLIHDIQQEVGHSLKIVLTGGIAPLISKIVKTTHILDKELVLNGLYQIYQKNEEKHASKQNI